MEVDEDSGPAPGEGMIGEGATWESERSHGRGEVGSGDAMDVDMDREVGPTTEAEVGASEGRAVGPMDGAQAETEGGTCGFPPAQGAGEPRVVSEGGPHPPPHAAEHGGRGSEEGAGAEERPV